MKRLFALMLLLSIALAAPTAADIADTAVKVSEITPFDATGSSGDLVQYTWVWDDGDSDTSNYWAEKVTIVPPYTSVVGLHIGCVDDMYITSHPDNYEAVLGGPDFETIASAVVAGQVVGVKPGLVSDMRWLLASVDGFQSKVYSFKCDDLGHVNTDMDWVPTLGNEITALGYLPPSGICMGGECIAGGQMIAGTKDAANQHSLFYNGIKAKPPDYEKVAPQGTQVMSWAPPNSITSIETYRNALSGVWVAVVGSGSPPKLGCYDNGWAAYNEFSVPGYDVLDVGEVTTMHTGTKWFAVPPMNPPGELIVASAKFDGVWTAKLHRASFPSENPNCAAIAGSFVEYPIVPLAKIHDITVKPIDGSLWIAGETPAGEARVFYSPSADPATAMWLDMGEFRDAGGAVPNVANSIMYNKVDGLMYAGTGSMEAQVFRGLLSPLASHSWFEPGSYGCTLTASEASGALDVDDFTVTVAGRLAQPGIVVKRGKLLTFVGSYSTIESGAITSYAWDFDDGSTGTGEVVEHKYDDKGKYYVELTVSDDDGHSAVSHFVVLVGIPPVAKMSVDPREPEAKDLVTFDASESYDSDGTIESYEWVFPNKNSCAGVGVLSDVYPVERVACPVPADSKACYEFHEPCTYDVVLTVTDDDGLPDELGVKQVVHTRGVKNKVWDLAVDATATYDTRVGKMTRVPIEVKNNGLIESPDFVVCVESTVPTGIFSTLQCSEQSSSLAAGQGTVVELPVWIPSCVGAAETCTVTLNIGIDYNEDFVFITPGAIRVEGLGASGNNKQAITVNIGKAQEIGTEVLTPEFPELALLFALLVVPFIAYRRMKR